MQLNFGRIFVSMDILRSSNYFNPKIYLKILYPTAGEGGGDGGGGGVVLKHHLKHASRKKVEGLKHDFCS